MVGVSLTPVIFGRRVDFVGANVTRVDQVRDFAGPVELRPLLKDSRDKAAIVVDYIEKRAGLLIGQGEKKGERQFAFPHRSFQEFLAACHLAAQDDFAARCLTLALTAPLLAQPTPDLFWFRFEETGGTSSTNQGTLAGNMFGGFTVTTTGVFTNGTTSVTPNRVQPGAVGTGAALPAAAIASNQPATSGAPGPRSTEVPRIATNIPSRADGPPSAGMAGGAPTATGAPAVAPRSAAIASSTPGDRPGAGGGIGTGGGPGGGLPDVHAPAVGHRPHPIAQVP